jgi:hypothetical protein
MKVDKVIIYGALAVVLFPLVINIIATMNQDKKDSSSK